MPLITQITHLDIQPGGRESILDHVWINQFGRLSSGEFDVDITNHYPIFVSQIVPLISDKVRKSFRDHLARSIDSLRDFEVAFSCDFF